MSNSESKTRNAASRRLHAMDAAAEFVVTTGGFVVLAAVLGICVYLLWVVLPLFSRGHLTESSEGKAEFDSKPAYVLVDPYLRSAGVIDRSYRAMAFDVADGQVAGEVRLGDGQSSPSAMSFARNGSDIALGYADGRVSFGHIVYQSEPIEVEEDESQEQAGRVELVEGGYIEHLGEGRARRVVLETELGAPVELKSGSGAVVSIDYRKDPTGKQFLAALREDGTVLVNSVRTIRPLGGGAPRIKLRTKSFQLDDVSRLPKWFEITADGRQVLCVWENGAIERYAKINGKFGLAERFDAFERADEHEQRTVVSTANMLLGGQTLMLGFSDGHVRTYHVADDERLTHPDSMMLVQSHHLRSSYDRVVAIAPSERDRTIAILHENGRVEVRHLTSSKLVSDFQSGVDKPRLVCLTPKNDGVMIVGEDGQFVLQELDLGYPEFSIVSLFGRVHYEGVAQPEYVYQSSSGDDASEIKLSLMPLIFGTLKATIFAMLFAIPIAVLAAVYSSEFVSKRVRKKIKPTVELMASLPSVVLGFVAAFVAAPFFESHLETIVLGMFVVPIAVLIGAHVWQLIPLAFRLRMRTGHQLVLIGCVIALGLWGSFLVGPNIVHARFAPDAFDSAMLSGEVEDVPDSVVPKWASGNLHDIRTIRRLRRMNMAVDNGVVVRATEPEMNHEILDQFGLEHGDLQRWLNGEYGRAVPGWELVFFPVSCLVVWVLQAVFLRRRLDVLIADSSGLIGSLVVLGKFVALLGLSIAGAMVLARLVDALGYDPRDSIFGAFSSRNTLVVAVIMGFAVIPIIYTISEDALQAVPMTLRSASLGAGATPWQTAVRVVMPVAASGIFSACMIGLGRAVGETMIVLMATGNTPEMDWNIFSGFRTLAANIAVELPEAPKDETHYRVLFLCGLVLFVMTFVINTLAELVRIVVRARNAGL